MWKPWLHMGTDAVVWLVVVPGVTFLRYDFNLSLALQWTVLASAIVVAAAQVVAGLIYGLYRRNFLYGSFDEVKAVGFTVFISGVVLQTWLLGLAVVDAPRVPMSVPMLGVLAALAGMVTLRTVWREWRQRKLRPNQGKPLVVVGAGFAGEQVIRQLLTDSSAPYLPVALVDDDPLKSNLKIQGIQVKGSLDQLASLVETTKAVAILLAIPSAPTSLTRRVADIARVAGVSLLVLPRVEEMLGGVRATDIRPVRPEDLLGRDQVEIDEAKVRAYLKGKRVLVTGAGGSIGSELCRQLSRHEPEVLVMLDRDESGLHATQLTIDGHGLLNSPNIVLADIRDSVRMHEVFAEFRPQVVFHAAALKHMPLLEMHPGEAWKTNVQGTHNVLTAAQAVGVEHFVNISTDKAADPRNVLGGTKRVTERLTAGFAEVARGPWVSVRFGNVLGSRGSVLTAFEAQVKAGGPLTVTHPHVTRYFMTVQEAVRLTIFAAAIGRSGEVLVLDMGDPVRIADVAQRFAETVTPPLEIVFTGLRPGEKLHEVLFAPHEKDERPIHPMVSHVPVPPLAMKDLPDDGMEDLLDLA